MSEVMERDIGSEFRIVNQLIHRKMEFFRMEDQCTLTWVQTHIICFLIKHQEDEKGIFQKDVEKEFDIRRSTASGILQLMETNGYLIRQPVLRDGRLKKLVLTAKAMEIHDRISEQILRTENQLVWDFTEEEKAELMRLLRKMSDNLDRNSV